MCELGQFQTIVHGGEMKGNPEMGETAIQPVPAQTTDLSISGLGLISPLCICGWILKSLFS